MAKDLIYNYCREKGYTVESELENKKSLIFFLEKNGKKYVLKQLTVSEKENIDKKFINEIDSIKSVDKVLNKNVKAPNIVSSNKEHHFYISEYIEGTSLNILCKPLDTKFYELINIHRDLFSWLGNFYDYYLGTDNSLNHEFVLEKGPYIKKRREILNDFHLGNHLISLFKNYKVPISKVHGDLVPWNIIITKNNKIYLIDWGNSGFDYPALDLARYLLQIIRKTPFGNVKSKILRLFWKNFNYIYGYNVHVFKVALLFQYQYSMKIVNKNFEGVPLMYAYHLFNKMYLLYARNFIERNMR